MKSSRNLPAMQAKVGALLAVAVGVTLLALIFPTKGVNPLSPKAALFSHFADVAGLRGSSPVWFNGVEVGSVSSVDFVPGTHPPRLRVVLQIERRVLAFLRADSRARIKSMGMLGDMYLELTPGTDGAGPLADGAEIVGVPPENTGEALSRAVASAGSLLEHLDSVAEDLDAGRGSLGRLLQEPGLYEDLREAVQGLKTVTAELTSGGGTANKLLSDPALYDELVATVRDLRAVVEGLKTAEEKLISSETKTRIETTVNTASRLVEKVGEYEEKLSRIRFDFNFGLDRFTRPVSVGRADLLIWPSAQRYYLAGIQKISTLYGHETEETTFQAELAWRLFNSPFFIRGGIIRSEYFVAGADLRLWEDRFKVLVDAYRVDFDPFQLDVRAGVTVLDAIELTAGVEDVLRSPFYKAGLTIHYQDDDLLGVAFKTVF